MARSATQRRAAPITPAPTSEPRRTSRPTVSVGCKLPNGLVLRIFQMQTASEQVLGGGTREFKIAREIPRDPVVIKGCAVKMGGHMPFLVGGYAITEGVDAEFWDEWMKQNADNDVVRNRLIFAHEDQRYVQDEAKDNRKTLSGLEPIKPDDDARIPKRIETMSKDD